MRLSKHFTLAEFLRSEAAARHDIDMEPPAQIVRNLECLANEVLEPIRTAVGAPIIITSGYRPPALNALVGGAPASDHMSGRAADFHAIGVELDELGRIVKAQAESLPVAKVIREFGQWIHIAIEPLGRLPTRKYLKASRVGRTTVYEAWV